MSDALIRLAAELRSDPVIAPAVADSEERPVLGLLAAAGPRAAQDRSAYTFLFEAIREGYLLHYGRSRLLEAADPDLSLLAGDFLYALGLQRLAARGDLDAVRELGDLISLSAQLHARERDGGDADRAREEASALWLAEAVAVGSGGGDALARGKKALRAADSGAASALAEAAHAGAAEGQRDALAAAADSIGFVSEHLPHRG